MIPDNVTLVVKAPNQQFGDQNIECLSSWTIKELKGHLSEVYPSKPRTEEQKIIYSGRLLEDNIILKDVLRTYDSQISHTMHLVCAPNRLKMPETPKPEDTNDGLRRRLVNIEATPTVEAPRPERQNDQNHNVEIQNYLTSVMNNFGRVPPYPATMMADASLAGANPAMGAEQFLHYQQHYMQYMRQYAQWYASQGVPAAQPVNVPNDNPPEVPPPVAPPRDEEARDWLDWIYAGSRAAILFSLVYFYSSPFRFLLVMILCGMAYLHQVGFFRDLGINNNRLRNRGLEAQPADIPPNPPANAEGIPPANVEPNPPIEQNPPVGQNPPANIGQNPQVGQNLQANVEPNARTPDVNNEESRTALAVGWSLLISFFTSLIPETQ